MLVHVELYLVAGGLGYLAVQLYAAGSQLLLCLAQLQTQRLDVLGQLFLLTFVLRVGGVKLLVLLS